MLSGLPTTAGRRRRDQPGERHQQQTTDLEDRQQVLRARRFAQTDDVDDGQYDDRERGIDRGRLCSQRHHPAHVVAEDKCQKRDRPSGDHHHAGPGKERSWHRGQRPW